MPDNFSGRASGHDKTDEAGMPAPHELINGELIEERSMIVQLCSMLAAQGAALACSRCGGEDEPIAAILIVESAESAWLACGDCLRVLPRVRMAD